MLLVITISVLTRFNKLTVLLEYIILIAIAITWEKLPILDLTLPYI